MLELCRFSGFFTAHGFWSITDGGPLMPILALELPDGTRQMGRIQVEDLKQAVEIGQAQLAEQPEQAALAVLIYDGYIAIDDAPRMDALLVEALAYEPAQKLHMALPYRPKEHPEGLAVHRPKFLELPSDAGLTPEEAGRAFFEGVDQHPQAAPVWNTHLDESI